ncbi:CapA family protein [Actinomycetota bacterium]
MTRRPALALACAALALSACAATTSGDPSSPAGAPTAADPASGSASSSGGSPTSGTSSTGRALEVSLVAMGDVLPHVAVNKSAQRFAQTSGAAYDYGPMYADVKAALSNADLTLCHMETPLSPDNSDLSIENTVSFNTPHEMATALKDVGVDGCDFAHNHTLDRGLEGIRATEEVIRGAGLGYAGPTLHKERAGKAEMYDVRGATIAHLAYTYTFPNSGSPTTTIPSRAAWLAKYSWPVLDSAGILTQAKAARASGADFVVVSMHWGTQYITEPTDDQTRIAKALLRSGKVDLILGTHAHVVQPCERINGRHVLYGMGNFISNQSRVISPHQPEGVQDGIIARFTLRRDEAGKVTTDMTYQPTRVERPRFIVRMATPTTDHAAWQRTVDAVDQLGGCGARPE